MIELSANAAAQLRILVAEKGLDVKRPDCVLPSKKAAAPACNTPMTIDDPQASDQVVERDGARLFVAADSTEYLDGCEIDYEDGLSGAGFRVKNPHAARSCGCGTSFEPAPDASA